MNIIASRPCTAFADDRILKAGPLAEVALAVRAAGNADGIILVFDDATGEVVDLDLRGSDADIAARLSPATPTQEPETGAPRGPGRPKLGVVSREVTLLPRHWEWLTDQPGGASVTLRRLVDEARQNGDTQQRRRKAQEAAYRFMSAMAGNLPGFEEASRALFAGDRARFESQMAGWPADIRRYTAKLAFGTE